MVATEFAQVGLQGLHGKALQRCTQGGAHRCGHVGGAGRTPRQLLRHMRRNATAGGVVAPLQRASHQQVHRVAIQRSVGAGPQAFGALPNRVRLSASTPTRSPLNGTRFR